MSALAEVEGEQRHPNTRAGHHGKYKGNGSVETAEGSRAGGWEAGGEAAPGRKDERALRGTGLLF